MIVSTATVVSPATDSVVVAARLLFLSSQSMAPLSASQVRTLTAGVRRQFMKDEEFDAAGVAGEFAARYGDNPAWACARMRWAREQVQAARQAVFSRNAGPATQ